MMWVPKRRHGALYILIYCHFQYLVMCRNMRLKWVHCVPQICVSGLVRWQSAIVQSIEVYKWWGLSQALVAMQCTWHICVELRRLRSSFTFFLLWRDWIWEGSFDICVAIWWAPVIWTSFVACRFAKYVWSPIIRWALQFVGAWLRLWPLFALLYLGNTCWFAKPQIIRHSYVTYSKSLQRDF